MLRYKITPALTAPSAGIVLGAAGKEVSRTTHALLGRLSEQGLTAAVTLSFEQETVVGIFGQRGSGKSFTLGAILEGLANHDLGAGIGVNIGDRAVLVFDTLNIYQYLTVPVSSINDPELKAKFSRHFQAFKIRESKIRAEVFYPAGRGESFYPQSYRQFCIDTALIQPEDYGHIFDVDVLKDPMGHLLQAGYDAIKNTGYVYKGVSVEGRAQAGLAQLIEYLSDDGNTGTIFDPSTVRALRSRLLTLIREPFFSGQPTNISELAVAGQVTVCLLNLLSPELRSLVAALISRQLFKIRARAAEASKTLKLSGNLDNARREDAKRLVEGAPTRTIICVDEAQGYAPPSKANPCTGVFIQFVKEGRNHGLSMILTSQQPSAIHQEVLSQMDCTVTHRLTVQSDIDAAMRNAKGRTPERIMSGQEELSVSDIIRELGTGQACVSHGDAKRMFVIEIRPRVTAHGGIEG